VTFRNSILAGEELVRTGIRSTNYVAGVSGWRIGRDGSAEFLNALIRGELMVGVPDPVGPHIWIRVDGAGNPVIELQPLDSTVYEQGAVFVDIDGLNTPHLQLESPRFNGAGDVKVNLFGENAAASIRASFVIDVDTGVIRTIQNGDGADLGLGYRAHDATTGDSGAIAGETVVRTIANFNFRDGQAYRATFGDLAEGDAANMDCVFRIRKTNVAGTLYGQGGRIPLPAAGGTYEAHGDWILRRALGAGDLTATVVLTVLANGGNVIHRATAERPRHLLIEHIGTAAQYSYGFLVT
jgi:hypothetical protein